LSVPFEAILLIFQAGVEVEYWRTFLEVEDRKQEGRDPGSLTDGSKILSCTSLYLLLKLFIVLNEMSLVVYFLVGCGKQFSEILF